MLGEKIFKNPAYIYQQQVEIWSSGGMLLIFEVDF